MLRYNDYTSLQKAKENAVLDRGSILNLLESKGSAVPNPNKGYTVDDVEQLDKMMVASKEMCERASSLMMIRYKFFGEFIYRMRWIYTYHPSIDTMATDGKNIFINPKFCTSLTFEEVVFVLCHEILHNVMSHFIRERSFLGANPSAPDHGRWNRAADYEINPMVCDSLIFNDKQLIPPDHFKKKEAFGGGGGLYNEEYIGKSAEHIFRLLKPEKEDGDPDQKNKSVPASPGDVIRTKDGKFGVIKSIDSNGKFEIDEITQAEAEKMLGV